jgi:hypothetical protein
MKMKYHFFRVATQFANRVLHDMWGVEIVRSGLDPFNILHQNIVV